MPNKNKPPEEFEHDNLRPIHIRKFTDEWFTSDAQFNRLYPYSIQTLATRHWTPLGVARRAARFLASEDGVRILDIGSGVGKFCLGAAYYKPNAFYYGIEQRKNLVQYAETARDILDLHNVSFSFGNFTQLDFRNYDHFYFYNSFFENLDISDKIDNTIDYSGELYNYYTHYLFHLFLQAPRGTRLVTFHSLEDEVPPCFHRVGSDEDNLLKCWIKI